MYAPHQFREERRDILVAAMRDIQLAAVVTSGSDGLVAPHVPVVVREQADDLVLQFHVARQNPHWQARGPSGLAVSKVKQIAPQWQPPRRRWLTSCA